MRTIPSGLCGVAVRLMEDVLKRTRWWSSISNCRKKFSQTTLFYCNQYFKRAPRSQGNTKHTQTSTCNPLSRQSKACAADKTRSTGVHLRATNVPSPNLSQYNAPLVFTLFSSLHRSEPGYSCAYERQTSFGAPKCDGDRFVPQHLQTASFCRCTVQPSKF